MSEGAAGCPVIHKVTDAAAPAGASCPVAHRSTEKMDRGCVQEKVTHVSDFPHKDLAALDKEFDEIGEHPSIKQYRKLKRVMSAITQFYENGTKKKYENYLQMVKNLEELETDFGAVRAQLEALTAKPAFSGHPKVIQYREFLEKEAESFSEKKKSMEKKKQDFFELHKWSGVINEVCRWLEDNLDNYALEVIPDLKGKVEAKPVRKLTPEEVKKYSKGLDEISYNLKESQDFFQAGIDGRLKLFHEIEQEIIEGQINALQKSAPNTARSALLMEELVQDLEYARSNDDDSEDTLKRREKMLRNHRAYLKVLLYHTEKLKVLTDLPPPEQRQYDPKWTWLSKVEVPAVKKN